MGKNRDLIQILVLILIGMFIPFLGSLFITLGLDFTSSNDLLKVVSAFGYFLLIFAVELLVVYLYFRITNTIANKKLSKNRK